MRAGYRSRGHFDRAVGLLARAYAIQKILERATGQAGKAALDAEGMNDYNWVAPSISAVLKRLRPVFSRPESIDRHSSPRRWRGALKVGAYGIVA
jgi:hypothetical protein